MVSGLSSGGVLSAWLSAYAPPGLVRACHYEDPPLFASEVNPVLRPGHPPDHRADLRDVRQVPRRPVGVGDWAGFVANRADELPAWMAAMAEARPPTGRRRT